MNQENTFNQERPADFKKYIGLLISYSWLILLLPTIGGIGSYFYSVRQDTIYESYATLLVEQRRAGYSAGVSDYSVSSQLAKTYSKLVLAEPFLEQVFGELNLSGQKIKVSTKVQESPPLVEIHVRNTDPVLVANVANTIALQFIDYVIEQRLGEIARLQAAASAQGISDVQSLVSAQFTALDSLYLLEPVSPPKNPILPNTQQNVSFGIILGLLIAFGLTYLISNLTDTVKNPDEIRSKFGTAVLGMIFEWSPKEVNENDLVVSTAPKSGFAEAFKQIRTNLQFASTKDNTRIYMTTSPGPGDGKSTLISNLAIAISQNNKKVILIDGDMRRPTLHRRFANANRDVGLSNYLSDSSITLNSALQNTGVENVNVITSGPIPPNPSELLGSERMKELIKEAKTEFDIIMIDCPPVLMVADTPIISTVADMAILVVDSFSTKTSSFAATLESLNTTGIKVAGVIMNKVKKPRIPYGYGYGYGYYYNYYYYNYKYSMEDSQEDSNGFKNTLKSLFRKNKASN